MALLEVGDLRVEFRTARGRVRAVDGVSFQLDRGEALAVVGESGSGKTALALAILRLLPEPPARVTGGTVLLEGRDLLELYPEEMLPVRGRRIAMVFQEPATALNPVLTIGEQVAEAVRLHRTRRAVRPLVLEALAQAGIPDPERRLGQYPHQLSGGLRQRVVVAMALACGPEILIADEPTTALDVTVQARLLDLLTFLRARLGLALLLITHDLGVVARTADRVAVMYAGKLVETSPVRPLFAQPAHPYSLGLLEASRLATTPQGDLATVAGSPPDLTDPPPGCPFEPRCPRAGRRCREEPLPSLLLGGGRAVACHRPLVGP